MFTTFDEHGKGHWSEPELSTHLEVTDFTITNQPLKCLTGYL